MCVRVCAQDYERKRFLKNEETFTAKKPETRSQELFPSGLSFAAAAAINEGSNLRFRHSRFFPVSFGLGMERKKEREKEKSLGCLSMNKASLLHTLRPFTKSLSLSRILFLSHLFPFYHPSSFSFSFSFHLSRYLIQLSLSLSLSIYIIDLSCCSISFFIFFRQTISLSLSLFWSSSPAAFISKSDTELMEY